MRILIWSEMFWPAIGGVEVINISLARALIDRGHDVLVLTDRTPSDLPREEEFRGIPLRRLDFRGAVEGGGIEEIMKVRREVADVKRSFQPDVIHMNSFGPSALFHLNTTAAWKAPLVLTLQLDLSDKEDTNPATTMGKLFRTADWVSCVSQGVREQFCERIPEMAPRCSTIYNVVELPDVVPSPLPFDQPRLLCLGRITWQKGFDVALRAWAQIHKRFPQCRMVIGGDGDERNMTERLAADLGVKDSVDFIGWVGPAHVPALMNESTIVVMPSRREGLPLVALEASTMERPIVAARATGLPEIIEHGKTGILIDIDDERALAESIAHLLDHPDTARELGKAGRRRTLELFDWQHAIDAYCGLYDQLVQETVHDQALVPAT